MADFAVVEVLLVELGGAGAGSFTVSFSCGLVLLSVVDQENRRHIVTRVESSRGEGETISGDFICLEYSGHTVRNYRGSVKCSNLTNPRIIHITIGEKRVNNYVEILFAKWSAGVDSKHIDDHHPSAESILKRPLVVAIMAGDARSLGSFGSFAATSLLSSAVAPIDFSSVSGKIAVILKNIRKKDTVTKTKGLVELQEKVEEMKKKMNELRKKRTGLEQKKQDQENPLDKKELANVDKELADIKKDLANIENELVNIVPIWVRSSFVLHFLFLSHTLLHHTSQNCCLQY